MEITINKETVEIIVWRIYHFDSEDKCLGSLPMTFDSEEDAKIFKESVTWDIVADIMRVDIEMLQDIDVVKVMPFLTVYKI